MSTPIDSAYSPGLHSREPLTRRDRTERCSRWARPSVTELSEGSDILSRRMLSRGIGLLSRPSGLAAKDVTFAARSPPAAAAYFHVRVTNLGIGLLSRPSGLAAKDATFAARSPPTAAAYFRVRVQTSGSDRPCSLTSD